MTMQAEGVNPKAERHLSHLAITWYPAPETDSQVVSTEAIHPAPMSKKPHKDGSWTSSLDQCGNGLFRRFLRIWGDASCIRVEREPYVSYGSVCTPQSQFLMQGGFQSTFGGLLVYHVQHSTTSHAPNIC